MAASDLLGQIADARAAMQMRGYEPLVLEMGPRTARRFAEESRISDLEDWGAAVWNMKIRVAPAIEGWAVRPA